MAEITMSSTDYGSPSEESQRGPRNRHGWKGEGRGVRQPGVGKGTIKRPIRKSGRK